MLFECEFLPQSQQHTGSLLLRLPFLLVQKSRFPYLLDIGCLMRRVLEQVNGASGSSQAMQRTLA